MAKKQQKFHVAITASEKTRIGGMLQQVQKGELLIYGVAYHRYQYANEEAEDLYDYDIDEVYFKNKKTGNFEPLPLSLIEMIAGVDNVKELEHFHGPCLKQAIEAFSKEIGKEDAAMNFDYSKISAA